MPNNHSITLYFNDGRSDKTYQARIDPSGTGFAVNFAFGRRGIFGAWLGGLAIARLGSYQWMWWADMALAAAAAVVNLPIRESLVAPRPEAVRP